MAITERRVRAAVEEIRALAGDPEAAHDRQDALEREVVRTIARMRGNGDRAIGLCRALASVYDIDFPRRAA